MTMPSELVLLAHPLRIVKSVLSHRVGQRQFEPKRRRGGRLMSEYESPRVSRKECAPGV